MCAASFEHSLLSVDVDVCMYVPIYVGIFDAEYLETEGDSGLFPVERL